jgi:two-component system, sensor histidine kinase and response regulator
MNKVLIIDDELELKEEVETILKFEHFDVYSASDATESLQILKRTIPDLILCDILMPELNGFELFGQLKKNPETANIPFIFMTALGDRKNLRKGMELGADDYLVKPFTRDELLKTIDARLKKSFANQKQISDLKETIVLTIPHELRTPLNGILGISNLIKEDNERLSKAELIELNEIIHTSGERLFATIQKYLMFIDVLINKEKIHVAKIECSQQSMSEFAGTIANKFKREKDLHVKADDFGIQITETWFFCALNELIDNAFKFSASGQPVFVRAVKKNNVVEINISDKGVGFPEENVKKINSFVQFDRKTMEQQGLGLGLFLAKRIFLMANFRLKATKNLVQSFQ